MNPKKFRSLLRRKSVSQESSSEVEHKKGLFNHNNGLRFNKRTKALTAFALTAVILVSFFVFLSRENPPPQEIDTPVASSNTPQPTNNTQSNPLESIGNILGNSGPLAQAQSTKAPGIIETAQTIDSSVWRAIAANAWKYYQPGIGVDAKTGLPWSGQASPFFTDWDLGTYIQAVIDAEKLGLIDFNGSWGFNARIEKVLGWMETRELNNASYPYWFYQAYDGQVWRENSDKSTSDVDIVDTGSLFVALNNLRNYPAFADRVNNFVYDVYGNRSDYAKLIPGIQAESTSTSIYAYYYVSGFASFWPELSDVPIRILSNMVSADNVTIHSVNIPRCAITADVMLCSVFETPNNKDPNLLKLANLTYSAHEAYYNDTGRFRAFGEGSSVSSTDWQWEWVVLPDGRTFTPLNGSGQPTGTSPMIYTKVAFGFLALYNTNTNYTRNMCIFLEKTMDEPSQGYCEGVNESENALNSAGSLTNGLILGAARYYIENNPEK